MLKGGFKAVKKAGGNVKAKANKRLGSRNRVPGDDEERLNSSSSSAKQSPSDYADQEYSFGDESSASSGQSQSIHLFPSPRSGGGGRSPSSHNRSSGPNRGSSHNRQSSNSGKKDKDEKEEGSETKSAKSKFQSGFKSFASKTANATKAAAQRTQEKTLSVKNAAQQKWRDRQQKSEDSDMYDNAPDSPMTAAAAPLTQVENPLMFTIPLKDTLKMDDTLPRILFETITNIFDRKAYLEEGLFRLSASHSELQSTKRQYDTGLNVDWAEVLDPHLPAGLLKLFFRELPEPVFTNALTSELNIVSALPDQLQRMTRLSDCLSKLPRLNYQVVHEVFAMLKVVAHFQSENRMGPKNLAIIFVPALGLASANLFNLLLTEQDLLFEGDTITSTHPNIVDLRLFPTTGKSNSSNGPTTAELFPEVADMLAEFKNMSHSAPIDSPPPPMDVPPPVDAPAPLDAPPVPFVSLSAPPSSSSSTTPSPRELQVADAPSRVRRVGVGSPRNVPPPPPRSSSKRKILAESTPAVITHPPSVAPNSRTLRESAPAPRAPGFDSTQASDSGAPSSSSSTPASSPLLHVELAPPSLGAPPSYAPPPFSDDTQGSATPPEATEPHVGEQAQEFNEGDWDDLLDDFDSLNGV